MPLDVLIRGGTVYDGHGGPPQRADVAIADGSIRAIGALGGAVAAEVIDATGFVVAPGFIDTHTHSDVAMFLGGDQMTLRAAPVLQGVTTEIAGNCGFSPFPFASERRDDLALQGGPVFGTVRERWQGLAPYRDAASERGLLTNIAPLVGHGALRAGSAGGARQITPDDLRGMKAALGEALMDGALGISTGLIYPPGVFADREELVALARIAAGSGRPYVSHIRSESAFLLDAVDEAIDIGRRSGASVHISHHKAAGRESWGRTTETLQRIDDARRSDVDVWVDVYPYVYGSTMLSALLPPWVHEGGPAALLEGLADRTVRERIQDDLGRGGWENLARAAGWDGILIASCPHDPDAEGRPLTELADRRGRSPAELVFDMLLEGRGAVMMNIRLMDESDVRNVLRYDHAMIGSDGIPLPGKPHPRLAGTFVRVLGRYVRDERVLGLAAAIRKMTGMPAERFGLRGRGTIDEGMVADVVIFDAATVGDGATFEDPLRPPTGVHHVLVNGIPVVREGALTDARPGRVLGAD